MRGWLLIIAAVMVLFSSALAAPAAASEEGSGDNLYTIISNIEDQWRIWPADKPLSTGWVEMGFTGTKQQCYEYMAANHPCVSALSLRGRDASRCVAQGGVWDRINCICTAP